MELSGKFPNLTETNHTKTSEEDLGYNCIAWAAERGASDEEWWWPRVEEEGYYWPASVPRRATVECFVEAFRTLEYEPCSSGEREAGWQKVALYVDDRGTPTHMARQLADGQWTSKLGGDEDITHATLEALEGPLYGQAEYYLRRRSRDF